MTATSAPTRKPAKGTKRRPNTHGSTLPVIFGVTVAALLGIAIWLGATDEGEEAGSETAAVVVAGDALPRFVPGQPDPAVGTAAPALRGTDFDGLAVEVEPGARPTVVIFAAHWCPACQAEVTTLAPWLADGRTEELGVDVVAVSTGVDAARPNYPPSAWFDREGWSGPVLRDNGSSAAAGAYGLSAYPFFTFLDADGVVAGRHAGGLGSETFEAVVEELAG